MNVHLSLSSPVVLTPRRGGLCASRENIVEILVRIQAPDAPEGHAAMRPAQAIALVIDRSGSMQGRPLEEARRCADYVLGMLRPTDSVSLVQFDNRVQRLWPATTRGDAVAQRAAIAGIRAGGSTNLHGGWKEGLGTLCGLPGQGLKRVILLSDGQANAGQTRPDVIAAECAEWAARGVTTSTYGLGTSFNEELMVEMARAGGGNHYYGDTAEDLMEPFQQELELLGNLCLRDLRLAIDAPGASSVEMVNRLVGLDGGWRLPDLAWGAEAWAVVRLRLPASALPSIGQQCPVLRVSITGRSLEGEAVQLERAALSLPVLSPATYDNLPDDELVTRRLVELNAADALLAMRSAAAAGDWALVDRMLENASHEFAGNEWVAMMLEAMRAVAASRERERAMKEMLYSSGKLRSRLAAKEEGAALVAAEAVAAPAYLRRKAAQGKADV